MKKILTVVLAVVLLTVGVNAAFEKVNTYNNDFSDVKESAWYAANVKTAYELGFMNGKGEGKFDPDGKVTVAEGIVLASRLHSTYNGKKIEARGTNAEEFRFDFDENTPFVDLSARNQRLDFGVGIEKAVGGVEDGVLVLQSDGINKSGSYDPRIWLKGLNLDTRVYNKLKIRMKMETLEGSRPFKNEIIEFYFETNANRSITGDKYIFKKLNEVEDFTQWFEFEMDLEHEKYTDTLMNVRLDPTNTIGKFYVDYVVFTTAERKTEAKWYEIYVDYAVDNGILAEDKYVTEDMNMPITRAELCELIAKALPSEYYNAINDINGIPDVGEYDKNAELYLMLYRAGVLLGMDSEGTFGPDLDIKRSETSAIINRAALPENRVKGTIAADWGNDRSPYDIEFNDESWLEKLTYEAETLEIKDGALVLKAKERESKTLKFDPKITFKNVDINANDYSKLRIRMRINFPTETPDPSCDFYFMTEGDTNFSEAKSAHERLKPFYVNGPSEWFILELDFRTSDVWKGNVTSFRFDPANADGIYEIDYIRFIKSDGYFDYSTHEELINAGYTATRLLLDEGFEDGFGITHYEQKTVDMNKRVWKLSDASTEAPKWRVGPWWCLYDLWDNRVTDAGKYTLKDDKGINTLTYNPEEKSLLMRVDATKIYEGKPHIAEEYKWWPHLLITQDQTMTKEQQKRNSLAADKIFAELDVRLLDFKDTINKEGLNVCDFLVYYYLKTDKAPDQLIYFGLNIFKGSLEASKSTRINWAPDSAGHQYMYGIPQATVYGGIENSFNPEKGKAAIGTEWKHIRLDVTPHIERAIAWANRDNAFGTEVTLEDMYLSGANIGFEIHGNYDCTFEIKNYNMVAYHKN